MRAMRIMVANRLLFQCRLQAGRNVCPCGRRGDFERNALLPSGGDNLPKPFYIRPFSRLWPIHTKLHSNPSNLHRLTVDVWERHLLWSNVKRTVLSDSNFGYFIRDH